MCIAITLISTSYSCAKRRETGDQSPEPVYISSEDELTTEIFIQITIRYRMENITWIEASQTMSPEEQERYLNEMNERFFAELGITEDQYLSYGEKHADELDSYVQEHPELLKQLLAEE
jgi:hypothetical protein